jgi:radical SAM protein with 4Fe4S-binding SPASM domain
MPVWNRAHIIKKAIESVQKQTFKDYELIIIDDGSDDDLHQIVAPYISEDIIYCEIPHSGVGAARNKGIVLSNGDLLAYLDTDNVWHPEFLEKMYESISMDEDHRKVAYCGCNVFKKNETGESFSLINTYQKPFSYKNLLKNNYIGMNTFVHSKDCIKTVGLFDVDIDRCNDWDFILRVTSKFDPIFIPSILVDYYFCFFDNAITLTRESGKNILKIFNKNIHKHPEIKFFHDTIEYIFEDVSDKKYNNYIRTRNYWHPKMGPNDFDLDNYSAWGYPYSLMIEPTSMCNLACPLCPVGRDELGRAKRHMTLDEFKSVVDDMQEYLLLLILWTWGEPFMNPELPAMIRHASGKGIKTVTSTNAHFLQNNAYVEEILKSGLTTLIVAIDSLDEERYLMYRKKGNLGKAISGFENLLKKKKILNSKTLINLRMVIMKQNEHELPKIRRLAKELSVDRFTVKTLNPSCGSDSMDEEMLPGNPKYRRYVYKQGTNERIREDGICRRVWTMPNIFSNGDVVPCCYDYKAEQKVGNVFEKPFREIWNAIEYRELRKKVYNEKENIPKCCACDINFKLSESGWFVESEDYSMGVVERIIERSMKKMENFIRMSPREKINALRRLPIIAREVIR